MDQGTFDALLSALDHPVGSCVNFKQVAARFPVNLETLISIYCQESQMKVIKGNLLIKARLQEFCSRYLSGEDVLSLCASVDFPPCMMMRRMLEAMDILPKQSISDVLRCPQCLSQGLLKAEAALSEPSISRLQGDIARCVMVDSCYSPLSDLAKQAVGLEYEMRLNKHLKDLQIPFWSEEDLRKKGFFKTPDALLQIPITVKDFKGQSRCISWIDSKATFGDPRTHARQMEEQYSTYINRYGPGLVIYWFGFVRGLEEDANLTIDDAFPESDKIQSLLF